MNGLNNSADDVVECPLCMEPLEVDDLNFFPCTCGYQICRFCWHRIRTDENELCPACRKAYPENPADFTPLTQEEMIAFKSQKRQRDQQRKQKITENRKHLANVRVVQKNLVFVVGLPPRLADADILKKHEYFGKYGKIHKVVINPSTAYAGVQGPSASAYVTYVNNNDALRAIQSVNNINIDGRLIKTSLGTTKYCSHFMKNQQCPKSDCMYLHELGDPEASFTKEEMHQGKHQEYEKRLHDALLLCNSNTNSSHSGIGGAVQSSSYNGTHTGSNSSAGVRNPSPHPNGRSSGSDGNNKISNSIAMSTSSSSSSSSSNGTGLSTATPAVNINSNSNKDAWPSLSMSPVNKELLSNGLNANSKAKKEKVKNEKTKNEKIVKGKNNKPSSSNSSNNNNNYNHNPNTNTTSNKNSGSGGSSSIKEITAKLQTVEGNHTLNTNGKPKSEKAKDKSQEKVPSQRHNQKENKDKPLPLSANEEVKLINDIEEQIEIIESNHVNYHRVTNGDSLSQKSSDEGNRNKVENGQRSNSSSRSISLSSSERNSTLSESTSGKSSPENECHDLNKSSPTSSKSVSSPVLDISAPTHMIDNSFVGETNLDSSNNSKDNNSQITSTKLNQEDPNLSEKSNSLNIENFLAGDIGLSNINALSKLSLFEENNSFFSSSAAAATSFQNSLLKNKLFGGDMRSSHLNSVISSHLPDLLNGIDGYQSNTHSNEWEEAFRNVLLRTSKQVEEFQKQQLLQQQQQQQQLHQYQLQQQHQEELLRMQDLQKRNMLNNIGLSQLAGPHNDFSNISNNFHTTNTLAHNTLLQQQIQQQQLNHQHSQQQQSSAQPPSDSLLDNSIFAPNMSKFFNFHKNQQQQQQQQLHQHYMLNGHGNNGSGPNQQTQNEHLRIGAILENSRLNTQMLEHSNNLLASQQQMLQSQRIVGKLDQMPPMHSQPTPSLKQTQATPQQPQPSQQQQQPPQNRMTSQFTQNASVEDDLGFDPFIETQKGLAELMENEVVQQQNTNINNTTNVANKILQHQQQQQLFENIHRARMPPPGFNHVNTFNGFGGMQRVQNSSKMMPFMNMPGGGMNSNNALIHQQQQQQQHQQQHQQQQQQPQLQMPNSWNPHLNAYQQQQQQQHQKQVLNEQQLHQMQNQNHVNHKTGGYSSNDWTAMDPAILSLRQFPTFSQQNSMPHHPQHDLFLQHLSQQQQQQQQQQNSQGFINQPIHGGVNLPNGVLGTQQPTQAQSNYNAAAATPLNWFASQDQNLFTNTLHNGFGANTFDKFPLSMTSPGLNNHVAIKQKTECIN